jgi:thiol-disulfide isomerase/thioredoxin
MKKKILLLLMILALLISGCQQQDDSVDTEDQSGVKVENEQTLENFEFMTLGGEAFTEDNARLFDPSLGFGFISPEYFDEMGSKNKIGMTKLSDEGVLIEYASQEMMDFINELQGLSEEELSKRLLMYDQYAVNLYTIFSVPSDGGEEVYKEYGEVFFTIEKLDEYDGRIYYFGYNSDFESKNLTDEERQEVEKLISLKDEFKSNIAIYGDRLEKKMEAEKKEQEANFNLGEFRVETLEGEMIDSSFIKENKLTMINVWTTWCGPCINEMPDLSQLAKEMLPEGVKILSVCVDGKEELETAKEIIKDSGGGFTVVIPDDILENNLMPYVDAYPTTLFVDSNGILVGSKIVGAPYEDVAKTYLNEINTRLEILDKK